MVGLDGRTAAAARSQSDESLTILRPSRYSVATSGPDDAGMALRHRHITITLVTILALVATTVGYRAASTAETQHSSVVVRAPKPPAAAVTPDSLPGGRLPDSWLEPTANGSRPAAAQLYADCVEGTNAPTSQVSTGGRGRTVAVVGDSITTQVRRVLMADDAHHWVVWSRCGARTDTALAAGAVGAVAAGGPPDVVVIALGTNDTGFPEPHPGAADGFLTSAVKLTDQALQFRPACVVWLTLAQRGDPELAAEMRQVSDALSFLAERDERVHVADWAAPVAADSQLLLDRVHLTDRGIAARVDLLKTAVDHCSGAKD